MEYGGEAVLADDAARPTGRSPRIEMRRHRILEWVEQGLLARGALFGGKVPVARDRRCLAHLRDAGRHAERAVAVDRQPRIAGGEERCVQPPRQRLRQGECTDVPTDMARDLARGETERAEPPRQTVAGMLAEQHEG